MKTILTEKKLNSNKDDNNDFAYPSTSEKNSSGDNDPYKGILFIYKLIKENNNRINFDSN